MSAHFVGQMAQATLPPFTFSDEVCSRIYYVLSSGADAVQTVVKIAKSIFATALAVLYLGSFSALNGACVESWKDVGFSLQMLACSILGIVLPRNAYVKKVELHASNENRIYYHMVELIHSVKAGDMAQSLGARLFLIGQGLESAIRVATSGLRFGAARGMSSLSGDQANFVEILAGGAEISTRFAGEEVDLIYKSIFS